MHSESLTYCSRLLVDSFFCHFLYNKEQRPWSGLKCCNFVRMNTSIFVFQGICDDGGVFGVGIESNVANWVGAYNRYYCRLTNRQLFLSNGRKARPIIEIYWIYFQLISLSFIFFEYVQFVAIARQRQTLCIDFGTRVCVGDRKGFKEKKRRKWWNATSPAFIWQS